MNKSKKYLVMAELNKFLFGNIVSGKKEKRKTQKENTNWNYFRVTSNNLMA